MKPSEITDAQHTALVTIERVCSTLSLLGCLFIIITFLGSHAFHKPINRLVFFASVGNVLTNVATIIARSAVSHPDGFLCQFQAFLIQMFMPADAYWTLAMACNVYLTFFWHFDAQRLRKLEALYFVLCYGIPFIPAFVYIWARTASRGRMYGNATLWCWVDSDWDVFRIVTFYGPVWVVILTTIIIYARTGNEIYTKRKQLRNFSAPPPDPIPIMRDPFNSMKTTEIFVTSEQIDANSSDSINLLERGDQGTSPTRPSRAAAKEQVAYTVTVSSAQPTQSNQTRFMYTEKPAVSQDSSVNSNPSAGSSHIPISAYMPHAENSKLYPTRRYAAMEANSAAWSYTKVAVLFFVAMMVTWIPSSANRVYSVIHTDEVSLALLFSSAFVLPLQGFWNALIYTTTSLPACKIWWRQLTGRDRLTSGELQNAAGPFSGSDRGGQRVQSRGGKFSLESDSMTELAGRPSTKDSAR